MSAAARTGAEVSQEEYRAIAEIRYQIRKFLRLSEDGARAIGLEPQQHQLLLAVKGLPADKSARVGTIAERLQIQHHSAVELVDRMSAKGFVHRKRSPEDKREVIVSLTAKGERTLRELSQHHLAELQEHTPSLLASLKKLA